MKFSLEEDVMKYKLMVKLYLINMDNNFILWMMILINKNKMLN